MSLSRIQHAIKASCSTAKHMVHSVARRAHATFSSRRLYRNHPHSSNNQLVVRADSRAWHHIEKQGGFHAKNPHYASLVEHQVHNFPSNYISTANNMSSAFMFVSPKGSYIYVCNTPAIYVDVANHIALKKYIAQSYIDEINRDVLDILGTIEREREIAAIGHIPLSDIYSITPAIACPYFDFVFSAFTGDPLLNPAYKTRHLSFSILSAHKEEVQKFEQLLREHGELSDAHRSLQHAESTILTEWYASETHVSGDLSDYPTIIVNRVPVNATLDQLYAHLMDVRNVLRTKGIDDFTNLVERLGIGIEVSFSDERYAIAAVKPDVFFISQQNIAARQKAIKDSVEKQVVVHIKQAENTMQHGLFSPAKKPEAEDEQLSIVPITPKN